MRKLLSRRLNENQTRLIANPWLLMSVQPPTKLPFTESIFDQMMHQYVSLVLVLCSEALCENPTNKHQTKTKKLLGIICREVCRLSPMDPSIQFRNTFSAFYKSCPEPVAVRGRLLRAPQQIVTSSPFITRFQKRQTNLSFLHNFRLRMQKA